MEADLVYICTHAPCIVVIDEATSTLAIPKHDQSARRISNLIVLQTLSKSFGLAGIRLGIALASKEIIALATR